MTAADDRTNVQNIFCCSSAFRLLKLQMNDVAVADDLVVAPC